MIKNVARPLEPQNHCDKNIILCFRPKHKKVKQFAISNNEENNLMTVNFDFVKVRLTTNLVIFNRAFADGKKKESI